MLEITSTSIDGLCIVTTQPFLDERGEFGRLFCESELSELLQGRRIVQANISVTKHVGSIRGLHYQLPPFAEYKLVRCMRGRIWDVVVDLRHGSHTFLQWYGIELSPEQRNMIVIPEGFAHGFQALEPDSEVIYMHTQHYAPGSEGAVRYNDPLVGVEWPLPLSSISERDAEHALLTREFQGIVI
jgi:dTDP-4-dehydrorhamnose 3,5-epimerase